jgi:hypothetical protein
MLRILVRDTRHTSSFPGSLNLRRGFVGWLLGDNFPLRRENAIDTSYHNFRHGIEVDAAKRSRQVFDLSGMSASHFHDATT